MLDERRSDATDVAVVALAGLLLGALTVYPAGSVRVGSQTMDVRLGNLFGFRYFLVAVCAALVGVAALEILIGRRPARIAAVGYAVLTVVSVAWIVTVEGASRLIPREILPATIRRFTLGLGASPTAWLILLMCLVSVLACLGLLKPIITRVVEPDGVPTTAALRLGSLAAVGLGVVVVGVGRVKPLAEVSLSSETIKVEPWAVSYLGPGLLLGLLVMVVATLCLAARWQVTTSALIGAAVAWAVATISGLLFATSALLVKTSVVQWAAERIGQPEFARSTTIDGGLGAVILFAGAILAGLGFSAQLAVDPNVTADE